jgi:hypothetical protein
VRHHSKSQTGQTAVLFTLSLTAVFGMIGLVSDIGYAYYRKEVAQAAAQAAAIATVKSALSQGGTCGSNNVVCQSETACPTTISGNGTTNIDKGCLYAITNGFTPSGKKKVTIQSGSGAYNGITVTFYAVVKVSEQLPQLFSIVTGNSTATLTARSVVGYIPPNNGGCIWVTDPTGDHALHGNGNVSLTSGCGIQVDSSSSTAVDLSGGNVTIAVSGTTNGVANTTAIHGGYKCSTGNPTCMTPSPTTGAAAEGDPLSGIDPPTKSGCDDPSPSVGKNTGNYPNGSYSSPYVVCGTLSVPSNNNSFNFKPGTYIFRNNGSGCGLNTNGGYISGTGVTLYFESPCSLSIAGNGTIDLHAPTSGTYQGILFYQDRSNTTTAYITGNGSETVDGVAYFPSATLHFAGNGGSSNNLAGSTNTSIVAKDLELDGNAFIKNSGSSPFLNTFSGYALIE